MQKPNGSFLFLMNDGQNQRIYLITILRVENSALICFDCYLNTEYNLYLNDG